MTVSVRRKVHVTVECIWNVMGVVGKSVYEGCVYAGVRVGESSGVTPSTLQAIRLPCGAERAQVGQVRVSVFLARTGHTPTTTHNHTPPRGLRSAAPRPAPWLGAFTAVRPSCLFPPAVPPPDGSGPNGALPSLSLFAYD